MSFIKYFFQDKGNQAFCIFIAIYIIIFWISGALWANMKFTDHVPFDIIICAILLTIFVYSLSKYRKGG